MRIVVGAPFLWIRGIKIDCMPWYTRDVKRSAFFTLVSVLLAGTVAQIS